VAWIYEERKPASVCGVSKTLDLFDLVVADVARYLGDRKLERLVSQQLASADSVCANIEEGYGRESTVEYRLSATIPKLAHR
jgi:four helix bundle protein